MSHRFIVIPANPNTSFGGTQSYGCRVRAERLAHSQTTTHPRCAVGNAYQGSGTSHTTLETTENPRKHSDAGRAVQLSDQRSTTVTPRLTI